MNRRDITYQEKLTELRLDISHPNSQGINFVLVEGESDIRIFRKLLNETTCKVEQVPGGNIKVIECVQTLLPTYRYILGIRDADFLRLESQPLQLENIFLTDMHDFETTMLASK